MRNKGALLAIAGILLTMSCATLGSTGPAASPKPGEKAAVVEPENDTSNPKYPFISKPERITEFNQRLVEPYLVGPGDVLRLQSLDQLFPEQELLVMPDGRISLFNIGAFMVAGKEVSVIEQEVEQKLRKQYAYVECNLMLASAFNRTVSILGDVRTPGVILLDNETSLIEAIAKAGGLADPPDNKTLVIGKTQMFCRVNRQTGEHIWVDLNAVLFKNDTFSNVNLKNNDVVYVYIRY